MKKLLLISASALVLSACTTNEVKFTVNGTMPEGKDSTMIVLSNLATGENVDTTYLMEGKFTFESTVEKPVMMGINQMPFVAENGTINITLGAEPKLSGTPLNEKLGESLTVSVKATKMLDEKIAKYHAVDQKDEQAAKEAQKEVDTYYKEVYKPQMIELNNKLFQENRTNPIGASVFISVILNDTLPDIKQIEDYYIEYPAAKEYTQIKTAHQRLINEEKTAVGKMFTDFTVRNIENTADVKLSDYVGKGQFVLVDFWASWCGPCINEIPYLQKAMDLYGKDNFIVLGVNVWDTHQKALEILEEKATQWPQIFDPGNRESVAALTYAVRGIPTLILFAPDGTIIDRTLRGDNMIEIVGQNVKGEK